MKKTSDRVEAPRKLVMPTAGDFVQTAADRVGPLAQSAADRVGPLAGLARDRVSPYAQQAAAVVSPFAASAIGAMMPLAQQAADKLTPLAGSAKLRGGQAAQDAVEHYGPVVEDVLAKVGPAIELAREKVSADLLPKLTGALSAAASAPIVTEVVSRGQATLAAARGELTLPPPKKEKKGSWPKRLGIGAAVAAVAYVLARRLLGSKDSDWQAARPTTPYAPPTPAPRDSGSVSNASIFAAEEPPAETPTDPSEAGDDPQSGPSAHSEYIEANGEAEPDQPAEGGEAEAEDDPVVSELSDAAESTVVSGAGGTPAEDEGRIWSAGVYTGSEPPEGFVIKGNERSMKYHLPDSAGYVRTIAEVWFDSEEAAQAAGFVRAQP